MGRYINNNKGIYITNRKNEKERNRKLHIEIRKKFRYNREKLRSLFLGWKGCSLWKNYQLRKN